MKALVYTGAEKLVYQDVNEPCVKQGEVLIKVMSVGICGSDMHAYLGHDERRPAPLILGHEVAGVIVNSQQTQQRVTVNPLVTCMQCDYCLSERTNLCQQRQILSMPPREGGFAEYVSVPSRNLFAIEDQLSFQQAALAEPIAVCWHAVRLARENLQTDFTNLRILILGGGAIGLGSALVCQHFNADQIHIAETNPLRHDILQASGPFEIFNPIDSNPSCSFDLVIDAYGGTKTQQLASQWVGPGGIIVNIGLAGGQVGLDIRRMTLQDISFIGSYTYTESDFEQTVSAINNNQLGKLDWFQAYGLDQGSQLFEKINAGQMPYPKVILNTNE